MNFGIYEVLLYLIGLSGSVPKDEDYYTSLVGIQKLARIEQTILNYILEYKDKVTNRLNLIDSYLAEYQESVNRDGIGVDRKTLLRFSGEKQSIKYGERVSANPLLGYKLIRRFSKEIAWIMEDFQGNIEGGLRYFMGNLSAAIRIPDETDLEGAAGGLLRLQDAYDIKVQDFAQGKFQGLRTKVTLGANDRHYIGLHAMKLGDFESAVGWLQSALPLQESFHKEFFNTLITAMGKHNEYWDKNTDKPFSKRFNLLEWWKRPKRSYRVKKYTLNYTEDRIDDVVNFKALCRGETLKSMSNPDLNCYYKRDTVWTTIAPMKVEVHSKSPEIIQIYDLIHDKVINHIINRSSPVLQRARIQGTPEEKNIKSDIRTSAVTWISEKYDDLMKKIPVLINHATGLNMKGAEDLQISSYGAIGGHYNPHLDALFNEQNRPCKEEEFKGDRIATLMFYLSDVEKGGGTAFPRVGVATSAIKGSAVFWYNLKKNGDRNDLMLHGGCPVLLGNKWVANKWIRRNDQMFVRRCSLRADE